WPETAIASYFGNASEEVIEPLRVQALMEQSSLLIGGFYYDFKQDATYNSVLSIDNKAGSEIYAKRHLVPFSEYFPFLDYLEWLREWIQLPYDSVDKGTGGNTLRILGMDVQTSICYEDVYGNEIIDGLPKAKLLVNLSNDGWFTGSIEPAQHMQIARMRALETGRYLLRATNNGVSGIIDHKGRFIATADQYLQTTIKGKAQPFEGETPYVRWGNGFIFTVLAFILVMSGLLMRKKPLPINH
ncbi:MAG TPA: apolipoprotein N-acyltransferase, partial [Thiothrix sp.]|nr:apolipoprotein N-acyltransferase [Thiothrix sp.]